MNHEEHLAILDQARNRLYRALDFFTSELNDDIQLEECQRINHCLGSIRMLRNEQIAIERELSKLEESKSDGDEKTE